MKQIITLQNQHQYKLFNYDVLNILKSFLVNDYFLIFLDIYDRQDIESFMNKAVRMDAVLKIQCNDNLQSFFPYVKTDQKLKVEYRRQDWDFSCVVFDKKVESLFYIRGIEEDGEVGLQILETKKGLYDSLIKLY
ncbi:hypothetical protein MH215_27995 [Paenibacillus sp. ACRSA]|uniref:hypothetical protein n=1 Tax=Paenibacillus sp. ACRSA TaxID=2918211 RepID=UPI001EF4EFF6|nr:hypothetical protein [Paenibacillus sp. ACRSA]MCG7380830.1 hypothetical protein [Paenibacillus sp. ACRSA]